MKQVQRGEVCRFMSLHRCNPAMSDQLFFGSPLRFYGTTSGVLSCLSIKYTFLLLSLVIFFFYFIDT